MEEIRVKNTEWQEKAMRLRRDGNRITLIQTDDDEVVIRYEKTTEVRVEQPDTAGNAWRRVDL